MLAEVLAPMNVFATIFGVLFTFLTTRNRERLAMIEKDVDPTILQLSSAGLESSLVF